MTTRHPVDTDALDLAQTVEHAVERLSQALCGALEVAIVAAMAKRGVALPQLGSRMFREWERGSWPSPDGAGSDVERHTIFVDGEPVVRVSLHQDGARFTVYTTWI